MPDAAAPAAPTFPTPTAPAQPPAPSVEEVAAHDAADDKALDTHLPINPDDAKPSVKIEPKAEPKAEEKKPEAPKQPEKPDDDAIDSAVSALMLDNVPPELITKMRADNPKELIAWGKKAAKRHAEVDRRIREANKPTDAQPAATKEEAPAQPLLDVEALVKPFSDEFGQTGSDAVRNLVKGLESVIQKREAELKQTHNAQLQSLNARLGEIELSKSRAALQERFPEAKDDDQFEAIRAKARDIIEGKFDLSGVLELAASSMYLPKVRTELAERRAQVFEARDAGQVTDQSQAAKPKAPTPEEQEDAVLDALGIR